jgi:peptidoglycan/xylan/chitin deacetylase (PgdA/CDA1 family)
VAVVSSVDTDRYVAALTFDDGPALPDTRKLLDVLGEAGTRATFFVRGGAVDDSTEALVAEAAAADTRSRTTRTATCTT